MNDETAITIYTGEVVEQVDTSPHYGDDLERAGMIADAL